MVDQLLGERYNAKREKNFRLSDQIQDETEGCRRAGVRVVMITGDSAQTAAAIARDVNILGPDDPADGRVFVGGEFFELDEGEQRVVRRARNAQTGGGRRADARAYRAATGLEALVAHWAYGGPGGQERFEAVLVPALEKQIDASFERLLARPRRG